MKLYVLFILGMGLCLFAETAQCQPQMPRPEYPRPQMQRPEWMNLNGEWEFMETDDDSDRPLTDADYPDSIQVPFCRESELSGLGRLGFVNNLWYRREFQLPDDWYGKRIMLNIGGADWKTRVWVNDFYVGEHTGGTVSFAMEITDGIEKGKNKLILHVYDNTRSGMQPLGKQSSQEKSYGCFYTRVTGIWGTVWLEPLNNAFIRSVKHFPDPDNSKIRFDVDIDGYCEDNELLMQTFFDGEEVGRCKTSARSQIEDLEMDLSEKKLWSVDEPNLYDLKLTLTDGEETVDQISSYFGLREISVQGAAVLINGEPVFQRLVLDQGYYPDGIWTAPTDEALKQDIVLSQQAGFNGARLHQKVFEPRFLYWADRLGYIVWGEYANWGLNYADADVHESVSSEWAEIIERDRNHPSIVGWCPFNETPRSAGPLQRRIVRYTRKADPTRPVIETSGWTHTLKDPQILDAHDYNQNPESFRNHWTSGSLSGLPKRYGGQQLGRLPFFVSEYGGTAWSADEIGWGYGQAPQDIEEFYQRLDGLTRVLLDNRYMFGFCYTQLYDLEQEQNGIYTYDRKPKFDISRIRQSFQGPATYEKDPLLKGETGFIKWEMLFGGAMDGDGALIWKYTFEQPPANWIETDYADEVWKTSPGGFGKKDGTKVAVPWETKDIWLRGEFDYDGEPFEKAVLAIHYDNATRIFLNGREIWQKKGWNDKYEGFDVTSEIRENLKKGANFIAVHTHQDEGRQYIDMALLVLPSK